MKLTNKIEIYKLNKESCTYIQLSEKSQMVGYILKISAFYLLKIFYCLTNIGKEKLIF